MNKLLSAMILSLAVSTVQAGEIEDAKELIIASAKDPSSITFRNISRDVRNGIVLVCGEFNGKNSHGGYKGFSGFGYAVPPTGQALIVMEDPYFDRTWQESIDNAIAQMNAYEIWCR
jgi:hypothetical protein